jgi:hypothetical protein
MPPGLSLIALFVLPAMQGPAQLPATAVDDLNPFAPGARTISTSRPVCEANARQSGREGSQNSHFHAPASLCRSMRMVLLSLHSVCMVRPDRQNADPFFRLKAMLFAAS